MALATSRWSSSNSFWTSRPPLLCPCSVLAVPFLCSCSTPTTAAIVPLAAASRVQDDILHLDFIRSNSSDDKTRISEVTPAMSQCCAPTVVLTAVALPARPCPDAFELHAAAGQGERRVHCPHCCPTRLHGDWKRGSWQVAVSTACNAAV
jgi:hypothetical protein